MCSAEENDVVGCGYAIVYQCLLILIWCTSLHTYMQTKLAKSSLYLCVQYGNDMRPFWIQCRVLVVEDLYQASYAALHIHEQKVTYSGYGRWVTTMVNINTWFATLVKRWALADRFECVYELIRHLLFPLFIHHVGVCGQLVGNHLLHCDKMSLTLWK